MNCGLDSNGSVKTKDLAMSTLKRLYQQLSLSNGADFSSSRSVINELLKKVLRQRNIMQNLTKVRSFDSYAFDHSINVCMLSLMMGLYLKLSRDELYDLGIGALLHDIGMNKLDKKVLAKRTALTTAELEQVRRHPFYGYEILVNIAGLSEEAAVVSWQHHERLDGSGYPRGLQNGQIHRFAQIVAVADVVDALLSDRPFRHAFYPHQAVEMLVNSQGEFAEDVVNVFLDKIIIYPIGTRVELNTGDWGTVVDTNRDHTRPVIRIETAGNHWLIAYKEVDLSKHRDMYIVRVIRNE